MEETPKKSLKVKLEVKRETRRSGPAVEIVATYGWLRITFTKEASGRTKVVREGIAPGGKRPASLYLPTRSMEAQLRAKAEAIFAGRTEKRKTKALQAKHPLFILESVIKQGWLYHRQVLAYARDQRLSPAEAEQDLFKNSNHEPAYRLPDLPYLHPAEAELHQTLLACGLKPLRHGLIGLSRTDRKKNQETRIPMRPTDINAALRQQKHILDGYLGNLHDLTGEMNRLEELKGLAEQIHCYVFDWKVALAGIDENERRRFVGEIKTLAEAIEAALARCRNPDKTEAGNQAKRLAEPLDSRGRTNPPSKAARAAALMERLDKRMTELKAIIPIVISRGAALEAKKLQMLGALAEADSFLEKIDPALLDGHELRLKIGQALYLLGQVSILPYRAQGNQAVFYLQAARHWAEDQRLAGELISIARMILADRPFDKQQKGGEAVEEENQEEESLLGNCLAGSHTR